MVNRTVERGLVAESIMSEWPGGLTRRLGNEGGERALTDLVPQHSERSLRLCLGWSTRTLSTGML